MHLMVKVYMSSLFESRDEIKASEKDLVLHPKSIGTDYFASQRLFYDFQLNLTALAETYICA